MSIIAYLNNFFLDWNVFLKSCYKIFENYIIWMNDSLFSRKKTFSTISPKNVFE